jgi:hypothetical protein
VALPPALTDGFQYAFAVGAGMAAIGLLAALLMISRRTPAVAEPVLDTPLPAIE